MEEASESTELPPRGGRKGRAIKRTVAILVLVAAVFLALMLVLTGRVISLPGWVVDRIEVRANQVLSGAASAQILSVDLLVDDMFVPHVRLSGVELFSPKGARIAVLPELTTTLKARPVLSGRVEPRRLTIAGARIALRRLEDGSLDFDMGSDAAGMEQVLSPAEALNAVDEAFALPVLNGIESIVVDGLELSFEDLRLGRTWTATQGDLTLSQDAGRIGIHIAMTLAEEGRAPAQAELSFASVKGSPEATLTARVTDVSARDLAAQSPALAVLGAVNAPISGAIQSSVDASGRFGELTATLEIGAGALQPTPDTRPVRFEQARLEMDYDPETGQIGFDNIAVDSAALHVVARAKAWLKGIEAGFPTALIGQIEITDLKIDPEGVFADPVAVEQGAIDFRLRFDPFGLDLGQLVLVDGVDGRISARGTVDVEPEGWAVAIDAAVNKIESARLFALWPVTAVPKTRAWLTQNVATSELYDVKAAFRARPSEEPRFSLGYEYRDTEVRVIRTLPPIQDGVGYATISDNAYTLVVDRGHVIAPAGGQIDMSGSVMRIPDLTLKPAPAEFTLRAESTIPAALSLLDQPPFEFLSKAGRPTDIAEGRAEIEAVLNLALKAKILPGDVDFDVTARLTDVNSDRIVPGRVLSAGALQLKADNELLRIFGPAVFDGLPVEAVWSQGLRPVDKGKSRVEAKVELSPRFLDTFGIGLPSGSVQGRGQGDLTLELEKGSPPRFTLTSGLDGLRLALPQIGWSKPSGTAGRLLVRGALGKPVSIERLELEASGLSIAGNVRLRPDGALDSIRLGTARIEPWFEGAAELRGRGRGQAPAIVVERGSVDLRRANLGGGGQGGGPLSVALDRLRISEAIALTGFRGTFSTVGGLTGDFTGLVNGAALVRGRISPQGGRSAFRVQSGDAGATLRAAGIYENGVGGALDLALRPLGAPGNYDGTGRIEGIRVTNASALAELLNAISVVGLLTQLEGPGILFSAVNADFRLTPDAVEIRSAAATGPSLGVSAQGVYRSGPRLIDIQGTISPIYALNAVGQIFSRRGEGLFGFNYRMSGPVDNPGISVNPLSILTPGMFREIFRASPPKLTQ
ncbi:hypothetical protein DEA8626_01183 [Defluviimonas aquaemixtae]|uniref:Uncharacterized protein n=1 Tax=Albidovulum aquaemixtae TaxID=1542388 RepID=A0A2R8B4Y4_9RHOB|nr:AsmA-like C-terminal region-containing protein [Defluviimonas aquaemixtae]SPH17659.1 hypothetical protein DEA8626_01183 [Defluviimonas aquaemixtae]